MSSFGKKDFNVHAAFSKSFFRDLLHETCSEVKKEKHKNNIVFKNKEKEGQNEKKSKLCSEVKLHPLSLQRKEPLLRLNLSPAKQVSASDFMRVRC